MDTDIPGELALTPNSRLKSGHAGIVIPLPGLALVLPGLHPLRTLRNGVPGYESLDTSLQWKRTKNMLKALAFSLLR